MKHFAQYKVDTDLCSNQEQCGFQRWLCCSLSHAQVDLLAKSGKEKTDLPTNCVKKQLPTLHHVTSCHTSFSHHVAITVAQSEPFGFMCIYASNYLKSDRHLVMYY